MSWDPTTGDYIRLSTPTILFDYAESVKEQLSNGNNIADITDTSPFIQLGKAVGILPLAQVTDDIGFLKSQIFLDGVTGSNLDLFAEGFGRTRNPATKSTGPIVITLKTAVAAGPFLSANDIAFVDMDGNRYDLAEDLEFDGTTEITAQIRARDAGAFGNIAAGTITPTVDFVNQSITASWNANVDSFTNGDFAGGADRESNRDLKSRIRLAGSARNSATVDGIAYALENANIGITGLDVVENTTMVGGTENKVFDGNGTGTASETIDATNTRIAFKMTLTERRWVQHFNAKLFSDTGLIASVQLETDAAGSASGITAFPNAVRAGFDFDGTNVSSGTFLAGEYVDPGTYHLVFYRTSGSGTFDGATGGANLVQVYDGSWSNDANITNGNVELIGGVPPKGVRVFAEGGADADVAGIIFRQGRAAGIQDDGTTVVVINDSQGFPHNVSFERPTVVDVYIEAVVETVTGIFPTSGGETAIKDLIIRSIGGVDSHGILQRGIGVGKKLIVRRLATDMMDPDEIDGVYDITTLKVDIVDPPVNTGNIAGVQGRLLRVQAANIDLTLVPVTV